VENIQPSIQNRVYDSRGIATAVTTSFPVNYVIYENNNDNRRDAEAPSQED